MNLDFVSGSFVEPCSVAWSMGFYSVGALFVIQMFKSSIILSNVELYLLLLLACMIASFFPFRLGNGEWEMLLLF